MSSLQQQKCFRIYLEASSSNVFLIICGRETLSSPVLPPSCRTSPQFFISKTSHFIADGGRSSSPGRERKISITAVTGTANAQSQTGTGQHLRLLRSTSPVLGISSTEVATLLSPAGAPRKVKSPVVSDFSHLMDRVASGLPSSGFAQSEHSGAECHGQRRAQIDCTRCRSCGKIFQAATLRVQSCTSHYNVTV